MNETSLPLMPDETMGDDAQSSADKAAFQRIVEGLRGSAAARCKAVEALYSKLGKRTQHFMRRVTDPSLAEDLTTEVFIKVLKSADKFDGDAGQFPAWYWMVARRIRIDWLRKRGRGGDFVEDDEGQLIASIEDARPDANPEHRAITGALGSCMQKAFDAFALKHPDRAQCLAWIAIDGMSIKQIADLLKRSEHAIREYLSQCRKKLRPFIDPCLDRGSQRES